MILCSRAVYSYTTYTILHTDTIHYHNNYGYIYKYNYILYRLIAMTDNLKCFIELNIATDRYKDRMFQSVDLRQLI